MDNPVGWFEIYVDDMERAKRFYAETLETEFSKLEGTGPEMWAFPMQQDGSGTAGALVRMPGFPTGKNSVLIYFVCDDCAVEADRAKRAGGKIEKPKMSIGQYGNIALVIDSEGNMIGLHSMK